VIDIDPYQVLGLEVDATEEEIQAAWRREAKKAHPDTHGGDGSRMADVNRARDILLDAEARANYDASGDPAKKDPLEVKARDQILSMVATIIRQTPVYDDMIARLRTALHSQLVGCEQARQATHRQIAELEERLRRLKGPKDNFIEWLIKTEIQRGTDKLPVFDADESVLKKAVEILKDYSYGQSVLLSGGAQDIHVFRGFLS
jgi:curved DNA-binding protein CbpA